MELLDHSVESNLRAVFYTVNGRGLGHVSRLVAIAREWRKQMSVYQRSATGIFLTSSDHIQPLIEAEFSVFKIPAENTAGKSGLPSDYRKMAARIVATILEELRPSLLVVDGSPAGAFGELVPAQNFDPLSNCAWRMFVYRPVTPETSSRPAFRAQLKRFDRIIVPDLFHVAGQDLDPDVLARTVFTGPIFNPAADALPPKDALRNELDIPAGKYVIYVSTGGGGYPEAEARLRSICQAAQHVPDVLLLVAAGPLYRGSVIGGDNIRWWDNAPALRLMAASDVAISGAGCNSFNELMHLGVPTIFVPMTTKADDQHARALRAQIAGAGMVITPQEISGLIPPTLKTWRDSTVRETLSKNARRLVPHNGSEAAGKALLDLLIGAHNTSEASAAQSDICLT
jgi:UDP-N-acetylglucosamine--N-acetylmuramyl-(pentapeptide) pyrophosphoryl-undecaprenol N-acetylglucosamine transferase